MCVHLQSNNINAAVKYNKTFILLQHLFYFILLPIKPPLIHLTSHIQFLIYLILHTAVPVIIIVVIIVCRLRKASSVWDVLTGRKTSFVRLTRRGKTVSERTLMEQCCALMKTAHRKWMRSVD